MASGESARITGLPDSPGAIAWSPDGAAHRLYDVRARRRARSSARRRTSPKAPNGPTRSQVIDAVTYRTDDDGYLKPGYDQIFVGRRGRRRADAS